MPASLIGSLSTGQLVEGAVAETKESFIQFLAHSGVPAALAGEAADALIGRIITALARGEPPESAIVSAKEDTEKTLDQLSHGESVHPHQEVAAALAQGGGHVAAAIAKAVADAGGSPEAQKAAVTAWQNSLALGGTLDEAHARATAAGLSAKEGQSAGSVTTNSGDALVAKLSQGGPEAHEAVSALTAGMSTEQAAAFTIPVQEHAPGLAQRAPTISVRMGVLPG